MDKVFLVVRVLLGALFIVAGINHWLNFMKPSEMPTGDLLTFFDLFASTGYLTMVKSFEVAGGVLVLFRRTAPLGVVILSAIIVNIITVDVTIAKAFNPLSTAAAVFALIVAWEVRDRLLGLVGAPRSINLTVTR